MNGGLGGQTDELTDLLTNIEREKDKRNKQNREI